MAASFISSSGDLVNLFPRSVDSRKSIRKQDHRTLIVLMPFLLMIFAVFLAPERPQQFASICERHNPEIVCRVF